MAGANLQETCCLEDINSLFDISGKVAVVTGGGSGVGLMIASGLVYNGVTVYIVSRDLKKCQASAKNLNDFVTKLKTSKKGKCYAIGANLINQEECTKVFEEISKRESKIDILVNNAGNNWSEPLATFPEKAFDRVFGLNVKGVFLITRALVPLLEAGSSKEDPSRVINIGSIDGLRPASFETYSYGSSKAAVHHLTKHLANFLADKNITVNAIAAGPFQSHMMAETLKKFNDIIISESLMNRIGQPKDIAGACIFLSSKAGSWITGTIITLDGGTVVKAKM